MCRTAAAAGRMIATNHALTGGAIGLISGRPLLAIPAALLSHFICDVIPHYGTDKRNAAKHLGGQNFARYLMLDGAGCIILVAVLALRRPEHWLLAATCAFVATSPDLLWIPKFLRARRGQKPVNKTWFTKFAADIQWFQRPIGWPVEAAWFAIGCGVVGSFLR